MSDTEQTIILSVRVLDTEEVAAGTVFSHRCYLCGHHVCSAPSTQAIFAANPGKVKFVCPQCFNPEPGDTINADVLDETLRELDGPFEKVTKS